MEPPLILDLKRAAPDGGKKAASKRSGTAVKLAVLAHLTLAAAIVLCGPWHGGTVALMMVVAVPFAQASLIAIWAGTRGWSSAVRFAAAAAGAGWSWLVAMAVLQGIALRSTESAGWAAGLATQAVAILVALAIWSARRPVAGGERQENGARGRLQYTLGSLLGWTAVVAALLSFARTAPLLFGWSDVTRWSYFRFLPVLGLFHAAYALLLLWSLTGERLAARRILRAAAILATLACVQPQVLRLLFGDAGGLSHGSALVLAAAQAALISATLVFLRFCRSSSSTSLGGCLTSI